MAALRKGDVSRTEWNIPVRVPHELLAEEFEEDPSIGLRTMETRDTGELSPNYYTHPLLAFAPSLWVPLGIFMDGVKYSITDSVLGVWVINWVTGRRHLCALVRKRILCRCGCKGWCTLWPLLHFLHWSLMCLKERVFPNTRHDGKPWWLSDRAREAMGLIQMKYHCLLLQLKGDWAEICHFGAFPTH